MTIPSGGSVSEEFLEFIRPLSVMALAELARDLRQHPEDKEHLRAVLVEISKRDQTDPTIEWNRLR